MEILRADRWGGVSRNLLIGVMFSRHCSGQRRWGAVRRRLAKRVDKTLARLEARGLARRSNVRSGLNRRGPAPETWLAIWPEDEAPTRTSTQPRGEMH